MIQPNDTMINRMIPLHTIKQPERLFSYNKNESVCRRAKKKNVFATHKRNQTL